MLRRGHRLTYLLLRPYRVAVRQFLCREARKAPAALVGCLGAVVTRGLPVVLPGTVVAPLAVGVAGFCFAEEVFVTVAVTVARDIL